jgi:hypothetical protein
MHPVQSFTEVEASVFAGRYVMRSDRNCRFRLFQRCYSTFIKPRFHLSIVHIIMPLFGPSYFESQREIKLTQRQNALDASSEALSSIPIHPNEPEILSTPAYLLSSKIASNEWSSLVVVAAFARQCISVHDETNCLTEGLPSNFWRLCSKC